MPREIGWSPNSNLLYKLKRSKQGYNNAISKEIGMGTENKLIEDLVDKYTCDEVCISTTSTTSTTTTTSTSTTTTTTTTESPALLCAENWETSYIPVSGTLAVVESEAIGDCEVYTLANYSNKSNVVKRDASANVLWQTTVSASSPCTDEYVPIKIVAGTDGSSYVLKKDALFKLDSSGALVWYKNYNIGTNNFVEFVSFALSTDGFLYAIGKRDTNQQLFEPLYSPALGKFNATTGALVAEQTYYLPTFPDDNLNQPPTDIKIDAAGNIIILHHNTTPLGQFEPIVIKINSSLAVVWDRRLSYSTGQVVVEFATDASNNIILASVNPTTSPTDRTSVTKLDSTGAISWSADITKNSTIVEDLKSITTDSASNIYVCGSVVPGGAQYVVKLSSAGSVSYALEMTAPAPNTLQMVDVNGNTTIAGDKLYVSVVSNVTAPATYQSELIKINPSAMPVGTYGNFTYTNQTALYGTNALTVTSSLAGISVSNDTIIAGIAGTCAATGSSTPIATYTKTVI